MQMNFHCDRFTVEGNGFIASAPFRAASKLYSAKRAASYWMRPAGQI